MLTAVCLIVAIILFVLAAFDIPKCLPIGLAFFALAFAVQFHPWR